MPRTAWISTAWIIGLCSASIAVGSLCGCSLEDIFPSSIPTLPNTVAVDRALRLCSLTEGEQPFHLEFDISPPEQPEATAGAQQMRAQIGIFWLNPITYRTEIRSAGFSQTRIVNGNVVEEHDTGNFYPRWIENFVDALLNPVPKAASLRDLPGSVPVGVLSHACITAPAPSNGSAADLAGEAAPQICFQNAEPRIASGTDLARSVGFDDFAPFGSQLIARTLVNQLPANLLVRGRVTLLEPLRQEDYPLLKAKEYTLPEKQILTTLVSEGAAQSLLQGDTDGSSAGAAGPRGGLRAAQSGGTAQPSGAGGGTRIYVRTDRAGKVREAYRDTPGEPGFEDDAAAHALTLHFKPLVVGGVAQQMEAVVALP